MNEDYITFLIIFVNINICVVLSNGNKIPMYNMQGTGGHGPLPSYPLLSLEHSKCSLNNRFRCAYATDRSRVNKSFNSVQEHLSNVYNKNRINSFNPIHTNNMMYPSQNPIYTSPIFRPATLLNMYLSNNRNSEPNRHIHTSGGYTPIFSSSLAKHRLSQPSPNVHKGVTKPTLPNQIRSPYEKFARSLDNFERKFYVVTFKKLTAICPQDRRVNGMSFVQSGFFLLLTLMALSLEVDLQTRREIEKTIGFRASNTETEKVIKQLISSLPNDSEKLKFRYASRLALWPGRELSTQFRVGAATSLRLIIDSFNGTERPEEIHTILNKKIEIDSGGAIRETFDEEDFTEGVTSVLITTLYFRARWRVAPTVLNGTWHFYDSDDSLRRTVRMIKLNDVIGYADVKEWNAQALEISYASPDLSLVMIVPRVPSLRKLVDYVTGTSIKDITRRMKKIRAAVILPLYTLRMTLLVPNKLQAMGVSRLFNVTDIKLGDPLRLSHMVQRLMFWAEAGRNAYKDDGLEWDVEPEMQLLINRPYIFFVRWRNLTLMNGNFVL